jgi:hypothetical protein
MLFQSLGNFLLYNIAHNIHTEDRFIPLSTGKIPHIIYIYIYINYYSSPAMHMEATVKDTRKYEGTMK